MRTLTFAGVGLTALLASAHHVHAHVSLDTPVSRYYQTSARQADQAKQKTGPCGSSDDSRTTTTSLITRFRPGETIVVSWRETIQHPGHFRIAFDDDGQDFSLPGESPPAGVVILADDIADKSGGNGVAYSQEVTLPNVECDRCTLQLIQVMTSGEPPYKASDLYFNCADLVLAAAGGSSSTTSSLGGAGGMSARATGGAGGTNSRTNMAGGAGGTDTQSGSAGGAHSNGGDGGGESAMGGSASRSGSDAAQNQGGFSSRSATRTTVSLGSRSGLSFATTNSSIGGNEEHGTESQTGGAKHADREASSGGAEAAVLTSNVDPNGAASAPEKSAGCHLPAKHTRRGFASPALLAIAWIAWRCLTRPRLRARTSGR